MWTMPTCWTYALPPGGAGDRCRCRVDAKYDALLAKSGVATLCRTALTSERILRYCLAAVAGLDQSGELARAACGAVPGGLHVSSRRSAIDMVTKLSTLEADGEVVHLGQGPAAVVAAVRGWREAMSALKPAGDVDRALQKALTLAHTPFEQAVKVRWCSRLRDRPDMFEVRVNGVRFYGGRITTVGQPPAVILLFAGAEQKAGSRAADSAVLDRAEAQLEEIRRKLAEQPASVVALHDRHRRSTPKGAK